jgi:hypothetical protein
VTPARDELSPLTDAERKLALRLAAEHATLGAALAASEQAVVIHAAGPGRGGRAGARRAVITAYDYSANRSVVAAVDLRRKKIVDVHDVPVQFQLSPEEKTRAEGLAAKDSRVKRFLAGRPMRPLTRLYFPPTSAAHDPPHRYAIVFLRPTTSERRYAVVDLSSKRVTEVLGPEHLSGD